MTYRPASVPPGAVPAPAIEARLEPDAIGAAQDTVTGMASSAPAGTMAATLAAASAYGSRPVLVLTALPMLVIANSYRRLNLWSANCGASFEWVGRAINPYLANKGSATRRPARFSPPAIPPCSAARDAAAGQPASDGLGAGYVRIDGSGRRRARAPPIRAS